MGGWKAIQCRSYFSMSSLSIKFRGKYNQTKSYKSTKTLYPKGIVLYIFNEADFLPPQI